MPALLLSAWVLLAALPATAGEWFDALIARVEGQPVLVSDITTRELLFGGGVPYMELDPEGRRKALDALIDRMLLLTEAERFGVARPNAVQVSEAVRALRARLGDRPAGLDGVELARWVHDELWVRDFVDARIRAFVMIREAQVDEAMARLAGQQPGEDVAAARARVRETLIASEAKRRLEDYLERLRRRAEVRRFPLPEADAVKAPDPSAEPGPPG